MQQITSSTIEIHNVTKVELCGSLLLAKLIKKILQSINISLSRINYWCDSTITLAWIAAQPENFRRKSRESNTAYQPNLELELRTIRQM